jgi:hypothetical protein
MKRIFAMPLAVAGALWLAGPAIGAETGYLIPRGWSVLNEGIARGDLNRDGRPDLALAVRRHNETELLKAGNDAERLLIVFFRQADGRLKRVFINKTAIMGHDDGGMLGDPFQSLRIERGALVLDHWGGSREQWEYTSRFRLEGRQWKLIGLRTASRDRLNGDFSQRDTNLLTGEVEYSISSAGKAPTRRHFLELRAVGAAGNGPRIRLANGAMLNAYVIGSTLVLAAEGMNPHAILRLRDAQGRLVKPLSTSKHGTGQSARYSWKALKPREDYGDFGSGIEEESSRPDAVVDATIEIALGNRIWKTSKGNYPAQIRFTRHGEFILPPAPAP